MSAIRISEATEADTGTLAALLGEVAAYYGSPNVPVERELVQDALSGPRPRATVLLARDAGRAEEVLGLASYTFLWPAPSGRSTLFLKELYVRESARRRGVARALMTELRARAKRAGCVRFEWTADDDNPPALDFYAALGAEAVPSKVFYRVTL